MFSLSRDQRRARRKQQYQKNIARLCEVETVAAETDPGYSSMVVTVLMTRKPDPQRGVPITDGYFDYIRPWWTTINKVGLDGVILHDGLPQHVIDDATTDRVHFHECENGDFPILHQRHFAVRDFLKSQSTDYVLVTDVSDVAFKKNPFEMLSQEDSSVRLFIGSETRTIGRSKCLTSELDQQFGGTMFADRPVVNPGILGGRREEVIRFLDLLVAEIETLKDRLLASDMSIINKVFHSHYNLSDVVTGYPLHSGFRKWEYQTSAAIMHK